MIGPAKDPCKRYYEGDRKSVRLITSHGDKERGLDFKKNSAPGVAFSGCALVVPKRGLIQRNRLLSLGLGIAMSPPLLEQLFKLLLLRIVEQRLNPGLTVLHDPLRFGVPILLGERAVGAQAL